MPTAEDDRPPSRGGEAAAEIGPLLARVIDRWESEGPTALDAVCAEHPTQADALRERVERLRRAGLIGEPAANDALPARLGNFRILSLLGRGGMGVVYLAEQEDLGRRVALKLVRPEHLMFPGARERFRREVAAVAKMQHAGIVPVYAAGEAGGIPYCAMELVRGAALEEVLVALAGRPPARLTGADLRQAIEGIVAAREGLGAMPSAPTSPPPTAPTPRASASTRGSSGSQAAQRLFGSTWTAACLQIAHDVGLALQHAHEQGVLHRDIKPSNIMVTPEGRVLLLDFGLAAAEGGARITRTGSQLGSLAWMSPEQVRGERDALDARTDVYSLGATLYELLTLRSPFALGSAEETRARILAGRAVPIRDLNPAVPRDAETVCLKAMDAEPARRYATPAAFADDLQAALELRPVAARRPSAALKARRWAQRNPAAAAAIALGVVLLVGGPLGYGLLQAQGARRERSLNENLQASNGKLDAALGEVRTANDGLTRALESEKQQRERAQRAFDRSRDAVDEMLASVGATDLADIPAFEPVRTKLLERALDFYRGLENEAPGDVAVRREQARTHRSMGDLLRELGREEEARPLYEKAVAELRAVLAEAPDDAETQHVLGAVLGQLGILDHDAGTFEDAVAHYAAAREQLEPLAAAPSPSPEVVHDLATIIENQALEVHAKGDTAGALKMFRQAVDLLTPVVAAHPEIISTAERRATVLARAATTASDLGDAATAQQLFGEAWDAITDLLKRVPTSRSVRSAAVNVAGNYGLMLLTGSDRARAESVLRAGFEAAAGLARDFPQDPDLARDCAVICTNLVAEFINTSRFAEAEPLVTEAVARLERAAAEHPDRGDILYYLGFSTSALAAVHQGLGRLDEAAVEADRGIAQIQQARSKLGDKVGVLAQLACGYYERADIACQAGQPEAALKTIDAGLALEVLRPDIVFMGAETLAKCARAARDDKTLAPPQRDALQKQAEDLALRELGTAITQGFSDLARVRTLPEWELVRARPEFAQLMPATSP